LKKSNGLFLFVPLLLSLPCESEAQDRVRPYLNAGYVTNVSKCDECDKADTGGSIRVGLFTQGRLGFYAGYLWFKEHHPDYIDYDDEALVHGSGLGVMMG
jgi:hypothetical protein